MDKGFGFGVLCAPARLVCVTLLYVFCLHCLWSMTYVHYTPHIKNVNRSICTYIILQISKTWTDLYLHTQYKQKTYSSVTHTNRAGAHSTPKPKPLSILPKNTSRVISHNTLTMTFVTTFNCNTVYNNCVKNM